MFMNEPTSFILGAFVELVDIFLAPRWRSLTKEGKWTSEIIGGSPTRLIGTASIVVCYRRLRRCSGLRYNARQ